MSPLLIYNIYVVNFSYEFFIVNFRVPCSLTAVIDRSCNPPSHDAIPWRLCDVCIYFNRYEIPPSPYHSFSSLRLSYPSRTQTQTDKRIYTNTGTLWGASELICAMRMVQYQPPHPQPPMMKCHITCRTSDIKNRQMKSLPLWMQLLSDHKKSGTSEIRID